MDAWRVDDWRRGPKTPRVNRSTSPSFCDNCLFLLLPTCMASPRILSFTFSFNCKYYFCFCLIQFDKLFKSIHLIACLFSSSYIQCNTQLRGCRVRIVKKNHFNFATLVASFISRYPWWSYTHSIVLYILYTTQYNTQNRLASSVSISYSTLYYTALLLPAKDDNPIHPVYMWDHVICFC